MAARKAHDDNLFKPLAGKRVFEEIYGQIRELIFSKTLKPGDKLPGERELAARFGSGRISVREALRMLEQSGLIAIKQGSEGGAFVTDVDATHISGPMSDVIRRSDITLDNLFEVRLGIESLVLSLAIERITAEEINQIEENIRKAESLIKAGTADDGASLDRPGLAYTNMYFHLGLARATRNPLLSVIVESLQNVTEQFFVRTSPLSIQTATRHWRYHKDMLKAIIRKDLDKAAEVLKNHNKRVQKDMEEMKDISP
jgi:GntR family transcriptional regulator, transcriptional repressor for pyruvate dehydrogenase complex